MAAKRILLIDDEAELLELLQIAFEQNNYKVFVAHDGEEGLNLAKSKKPNAIVLDIKMPKLNGYEFLGRLKREPKICDTPVVVFTSLTEGSDRSDKAWAESLEVRDFLSKPSDPSLLVAKIARILSDS